MNINAYCIDCVRTVERQFEKRGLQFCSSHVLIEPEMFKGRYYIKLDDNIVGHFNFQFRRSQKRKYGENGSIISRGPLFQSITMEVIGSSWYAREKNHVCGDSFE